MRLYIPLLTLLLVIPLGPSLAQQQPTIEQTEHLQNIQKAREAISLMELYVDQASADRKYKCMKAFGHIAFCECIAENVPVVVTFEEYVNIVTARKEELRLSQLPEEKRELVERTREVRNDCGKRAFTPLALRARVERAEALIKELERRGEPVSQRARAALQELRRRAAAQAPPQLGREAE